MQYYSEKESETEQIATNFAKMLQNNDVICLKGDLGAGKTLFCRKIIQILSQDDTLEVPSPTFTLLQTYETANFPIWHFDLYRLKEPEEIYEIGWEEANSNGVILIEWPQKLDNLLPKKRIDINIKTDENKRIIDITRITQ